MKKIIFLLVFILPIGLFAQSESEPEYAYETFKSTQIINNQSIETLKKRRLDILIGHRFGDFSGGWPTFYGFEIAQDVLIGADYGLTDNATIGLSRTKGAGAQKMLVNAHAKYRFLHQKTKGMPITATAYGIASMSTMQASPSETSLAHFSKFSHRMSYTAQLMIARKFSNNFSLQLTPGYTHRNIVEFSETNGLISLGVSGRIGLSKHHAIVFDGTIPFFTTGVIKDANAIPFGLGWEIDTGGHRFQMNFTNSGGLVTNDFISNTTSNWFQGNFGLGFTISRWFNM
jgi:hypothetical protein